MGTSVMNIEISLQEMYQAAYDFAENWHVWQIKKALEMANGNIAKAIEIAYSELDLDLYGGQGGGNGPIHAIDARLTNKADGHIEIRAKGTDHSNDPDLVLNNKQYFLLIRDGVQCQLNLF